MSERFRYSSGHRRELCVFVDRKVVAVGAAPTAPPLTVVTNWQAAIKK